ncbi:MAG: pyridoxal phosphate-dependent aminotransferase [Puniceicoccaceae bacterium]
MPHPSSLLSSWATNVSPSPTLAVDAKAKALIAEGQDVCGFGAGEPDFDTPEFIKEACAKALREGKTKYAPSSGILPLREGLARRYREERGIESAAAKNMVISPGGKLSCYLAILATCQAGDEVLIPAPYWVSYPEMVKLSGATPVVIDTSFESDFKVSPAQLRASLNERTKLLILNSPSNPTGTVYTRSEIEALVELCLQHRILVLSDEIYEYLLYGEATHFSPASMGSEAAESIITVSGFSKSYSMTGWRLGTMLAPEPIARAVGDLQSQTTSNATTFAQYGALAIFEQPEEARGAVARMLEAFDRRRLLMWERLNRIGGIACPKSEGAFYLFADIEGLGLSGEAFASRLLEEELVAVVPGNAFGYDRGFRVSYATSEETIEKGLSRIEKFCAALG